MVSKHWARKGRQHHLFLQCLNTSHKTLFPLLITLQNFSHSDSNFLCWVSASATMVQLIPDKEGGNIFFLHIEFLRPFL